MKEQARAGIPCDRVVAVVATLADGREQIGSGFLVGGRLVLTAEHCTRDKYNRRVTHGLRVVRVSDGASADVVDTVASTAVDVAVLRLADTTPWSPELTAPFYARVDREHSGKLVDCEAVGYPLMQRDPDKKTRDTAELHGTIYQTDEAESGRLLMREPLIRPGPVTDPDADPATGTQRGNPSPWEGLSGALIFYRSRAIGVVVEHHPRQGDSALRAIAFDTIAMKAATDSSVRLVAETLGLPAKEALPLVTADFAFETDPAGPADIEVDDFVMPHKEAIRRPDVRRHYLLNENLTFVSPGERHPTEPANLLRRLSAEDLGHGVLLIGPAGSGKSRTCQEIAAAAFREGWRVLHVRADSRVTTAHLESAVLREPSARTLLLLDYLDVCGNIDIEDIGRMQQSVKRAGGYLAVLATSRPAGLKGLLKRGVQPVFTFLHLRTDEEHHQSVAGQIFHDVAPQALTKLGQTELSQICGRLPVIALLIARDVEQLIADGQSVESGPRPDVLIGWLRDRLVKDGLLPDPRASTATSPSAEDQAETVMLACTLTVAAAPGSRLEIESRVQRFLDGRHGSRRAREIIDELCTMRWVQQIDDSLESAHDVVADELILQALAPPGGLRVHDIELHALLDVLHDAPTALDRFAANVARVYADLPADKATQLERTCTEWVHASAQQLGRTFAISTAGGHALYTLLHAAPWQKSVSACWDQIVEPWLKTEFHSGEWSDFLSFSLRTVPELQAAPIITTALVWLAKNGLHSEAGIVLRNLINHPGLSADKAPVTIDYTLQWLESVPSDRNIPFILRELLRSGRNDSSRRTPILDVSLKWVKSAPLHYMADFVLSSLISYPAPPSTQEVIINAALDWLDTYGAERKAGYVLRQLLSRTDLTDDQLNDFCNRSADWLIRYHTDLDASYQLRPILADRYQACPRSKEVAEMAGHWIAEHGGEVTASYLLPGLLASPYLTVSDAEAYIHVALAWLNQYSENLSGASFILKGLLQRRSMGVRHDLGQEIVHRVIGWLRAHSPAPVQGYVLGPALEALRESDFPDADQVLELARKWIEANPGDESVPYVLTGALTCPLLPAADGSFVDHALSWLDQDGDTKAVSHVLRALLRSNGITGDRRPDIIHRVAGWLRAHSPAPVQGFVLRPALEALRESDFPDADQVLELARKWIEANPGNESVPYVLTGALTCPLLPAADGSFVDHALSWLDRQDGDADAVSHVLRALLRSNGITGDRRPDIIHRFLQWLDNGPSAAQSHVLEWLLKSEELDSTQTMKLVESAFAWLDNHPEHAGATAVLQSLLSARALDGYLVADDADPAAPKVSHVLRALAASSSQNVAAARLAGNTALTWLRGNENHPAAILVQQAVLLARGIQPGHVSQVIESRLVWISDNPDHVAVPRTMQALLTTKWLDYSQIARTAKAAFMWLDKHPEHNAVTTVLEALLSRKELGEAQVAQATDRALSWLADNPDHQGTSLVLRAILGASKLNRRHLTITVDWAFSFLERDLDARSSSSILEALLEAKGLDHRRLVLAADMALGRASLHSTEPALPFLLAALLSAKIGAHRTAKAIELALQWLEGHSGNENLNYLLGVFFESSYLSADDAVRAANVTFEWLEANNTGDNANYLIQVLLKAKKLDISYIMRATDQALNWVAGNSGSVGVPFLLRDLLSNKRLTVQHLEQTADLAFEWIARNPRNGYLNYALGGLLLATKRLDPGRNHRVFDEALGWLSRNGEQHIANIVLQDLPKACPLEQVHVDRAFRAVSVWLGAYPDQKSTPLVLHAALTAPYIDVAHAIPLVQTAVTWVAENPTHPKVDNVLQGLLGCSSLGDPALAASARNVIEITFDRLTRAASSPSAGHVLRAMLGCTWLGVEDTERVAALALTVLRRPDPVAERHNILKRLLTRARHAADGDNRSITSLVQLALEQAPTLPAPERAAIYAQVAGIAGPPPYDLDQIIAWLGTDEAERALPVVMPKLLRQAACSDRQRLRLIEIAVNALGILPGRAAFNIAISLPPIDELHRVQVDSVHSWLEKTVNGQIDPNSLTTLLKRRDFPQAWQEHIRRVSVDILTNGSDEQDYSLLIAAIAHDPAFSDETIDRLVAAQTGRPGFSALVTAMTARRAKEFIGNTLREFVREKFRPAACAAGLGPVYEVYNQSGEGADALEAPALGASSELGLPVPVGGLDLKLRIPAEDGTDAGSQSSVTMFVAPGDGSMAIAVDIGWALCHEENGDGHALAMEPATVIPDPQGRAPAETPATDESVKVYDQVAVAIVDFAVLKHRTRADRVALLQNFAERELRSLLIEVRERFSLALVVGYDPSLNLAFWTCIDPDPSRLWRTVAGFRAADGHLFIRKPQPVTSLEGGISSPGRNSRSKVILRRARNSVHA